MITIQIFDSSDCNWPFGVNALEAWGEEDMMWLDHDDAFKDLEDARQYARELSKLYNNAKIVERI